MRFMVLIRANKDSEAGVIPSKELIEAGVAFNERLHKAGVLLEAEGLLASSKGARIQFSGGKATVTDGPFAETKELIAGYWMIQAQSKEEAIEWFRQCPGPAEGGNGEIEIRQVIEWSDCPPEILTPELRARAQA